MAFLEALEGHCATQAGLAAFRGCPAYAGFLRRWRLSIYFSTRFQVRHFLLVVKRRCTLSLVGICFPSIEVGFDWGMLGEGGGGLCASILQCLQVSIYFSTRSHTYIIASSKVCKRMCTSVCRSWL